MYSISYFFTLVSTSSRRVATIPGEALCLAIELLQTHKKHRFWKVKTGCKHWAKHPTVPIGRQKNIGLRKRGYTTGNFQSVGRPPTPSPLFLLLGPRLFLYTSQGTESCGKENRQKCSTVEKEKKRYLPERPESRRSAAKYDVREPSSHGENSLFEHSVFCPLYCTAPPPLILADAAHGLARSHLPRPGLIRTPREHQTTNRPPP